MTRIDDAERRGAGMLDIAAGDRLDRVGLESRALRALMATAPRSGRWDVQYIEKFIPTAVAGRRAIATPARPKSSPTSFREVNS